MPVAMGACENVLNSLGRSRNLPRTYDSNGRIRREKTDLRENGSGMEGEE